MILMSQHSLKQLIYLQAGSICLFLHQVHCSLRIPVSPFQLLLSFNRHVTEQELPDKRHSPHCIQHHMTAGDAGIAVTAAIDGTSRPGTGYGAGQGSGGQSDAHDLRCLVATQQSEVYFELLQSTQKCMCCNNRALHAISLPYLGDCLAYK